MQVRPLARATDPTLLPGKWKGKRERKGGKRGSDAKERGENGGVENVLLGLALPTACLSPNPHCCIISCRSLPKEYTLNNNNSNNNGCQTTPLSLRFNAKYQNQNTIRRGTVATYARTVRTTETVLATFSKLHHILIPCHRNDLTEYWQLTDQRGS